MRLTVMLGLVGLVAGCSEYTYKSVGADVFPPAGGQDPDRGGLTDASATSRPPMSWSPWDEVGDEPDTTPPGGDDPPAETSATSPEEAPETAGYSSEDVPADPGGDDPADDDPADDDPLDDPADDDPLGEDPEGDPVPGRIQGHIDIDDEVGVNAKVYCLADWVDTSLRIQIGEDEFVLDALDWVLCADDPTRDAEPMAAGFDTITGEGTGEVAGQPAAIWFQIADGGEPSEQDVLQFEITVGGEVWAASGSGLRGNLQALPPSQP